MNASWQIPFDAVYATSAGCVVLALIQLGSTLAFNIIVSLSPLESGDETCASPLLSAFAASRIRLDL
ncbi:hypothetical protein LTS10_001664 [Elasticomyces elasticus]|nr:hypothetical protein LTS10_001664 [Elasticomyces elasticus]